MSRDQAAWFQDILLWPGPDISFRLPDTYSDTPVGLGPIIGGFINYNVSWRWSFYVLLIWSGIMLIAITLLVPET